MKKPRKKTSEEAPETVLVVEDDKSMVELLSDWLKEKNIVVVSATNGKNAWELYKKTKPNLIMTDIRMPEVGGERPELAGIDLIKKIRKEDGITPIIVISVFDMQLEAFQRGADYYLESVYKLPVFTT